MYASFLEDADSVGPQWQALFASWGDERSALSVGPSFTARSIFSPAAAPSNGHAPTAPSKRPTISVDASDLEARIPFLKTLTLFAGLPPEDLAAAAAIAEPVHVSDGQAIVREGEMGREMFVVTRGQVLVRRGGRIVAELGAGEVVGEMAVLDHLPRSADAVARGAVEMLRLDGESLLKLLDHRPSIARGMITLLTRRLRDSTTRQDRLDQLIRAYRVRGHLLADLDPLALPKAVNPELNPAYYGFGQADLDMLFSSTTIPGSPIMSLRDILAHLKKTYCRSIGVQFMHIDDLKKKLWLQDRMEATQNARPLSREQQISILTKLTDAEIFEQFIHRKFVGAKRFSLEGAESLIPLMDMAIESAGEYGVEEVVIGMAHRGRLNVLANIMGKSPRQIFREFEDNDPDRFIGKGDVKYHLGHSADRTTSSGKRVHLSLTFNPSHLEFVSPVVIGRVRAKQDRFGDADRTRGMGIIIHGDAAFAGEGVVQETFNLSGLAGYGTGGTLHVVVNNQIGFTTSPSESRSTQYCTDVAKMLQIPIFHVNGEQPEAVAQAIHLAMEFRREFQSDVVIDMYCYRRYGHNEGDEPAFTQPLLYKAIRKRKSVRESYFDNLSAQGDVTKDEADAIVEQRRARLEEELSVARAKPKQTVDMTTGQGWWRAFRGGPDAEAPQVETKVAADQLASILRALGSVPSSFSPHRKIERLLAQRKEMASGSRVLDWAAAEALAFGTLLTEGTRIRICGQDAQRGTFSHRHAVLHDVENGREHTPLRHLSLDQGLLEIHNSPLTETAVIAYEYGYSLDFPDALVVWEAQFGDFTNVGQVIIDQFITSGEEKWSRLSGLVMLLPHGFEGQGPEHSSARLERFLGSAAEDNIQVANVSTPAQLFHILRRQILRPYRKPLVIMSPKSLLRHPRCVSSVEDLAQGGFQHVIDEVDPTIDHSAVRKVLFSSGKVYYDLVAARDEANIKDVAILRIEQYYPFDLTRLTAVLARYPQNARLAWVQEEPRNMGALPFIRLKIGDEVEGRPFELLSRPESASPATGSMAAHKKEQAALMALALE